MSTEAGWARIVQKFMHPPKPKSRYDPELHAKVRIRDYKRVLRPGQSAEAPGIFPYYGGKILHHRTETQGHLRRRKLFPSMKNIKMPVHILAGTKVDENGDVVGEGKMAPSVRQHMRIKDVKVVERAGGFEAKLISTSGSKFSKEGQMLRHALFCQLYRLKRDTGLAQEDARVPEITDGSSSQQIEELRHKRDALIAQSKESRLGLSAGKQLAEPKKKKLLRIEAPTA